MNTRPTLRFYNSLSWFDQLLGKPFYRSRLADTCLKGTGYEDRCDQTLNTVSWMFSLLGALGWQVENSHWKCMWSLGLQNTACQVHSQGIHDGPFKHIQGCIQGLGYPTCNRQMERAPSIPGATIACGRCSETILECRQVCIQQGDAWRWR
jgi:hypothetical protein